MIDTVTFAMFFAAALVLAITPGPGLFYVTARALAGGRGEGLASSFGTAIGGLFHVIAGAVGLSALVMASAEAFTILKIAGAFYLVWIGFRTLREARAVGDETVVMADGAWRAFREGALVEALNPKTAAFFLAFVPQFVDVGRGDVAVQFVVLGTLVVILNTLADVVAVLGIERARGLLVRHPGALIRARQVSGASMCGLGVLVLIARRP